MARRSAMTTNHPDGDNVEPPDDKLPEEASSNLGRKGKGGPKKKVKRIRGTGGGRPSKLSTPLKRMNSSRKRKYVREQVADYRGQQKTPTKRDPPLSPQSKKRKKEDLKRKNKISEIRKQAAMKRWSSVASGSSSDSVTFDDYGNIVEHDTSQDAQESEAHEHEADEGEAGASRTTIWRNSRDVLNYLSSFTLVEQVEILLRIIHRDSSFDLPLNDVDIPLNIVGSGTIPKLTRSCSRTTRKRITQLVDILKQSKSPVEVIKHAFSNLDPQLTHMLELNGVKIGDLFKPRKVLVEEAASRISKDLLTGYKTGSEKILRAKFAVKIVEDVGLSLDIKGDKKLLADAISSSPGYAKKVLLAIQEGQTEQLYKRHLYHNAVKASDWPDMLREFVLLPENSRSVPGKDTISIRRGVRVPKYILKKTKLEIVDDFLEQHDNCPFSARTLLREFPQFAVTATKRDAGRNTCYQHSNGRRMLAALQKVGLLKDIPVSCRSIASLCLCKVPSFDCTDPLSWNTQCCIDVHDDCPVHITKVPTNLKDTEVIVLLWSVKEDPAGRKDKKGKVKKVCSLFPEKFTVEALAKKFDDSILNLKRHIFTAAWEFSILSQRTSELGLEDIITIEDYQQNLSLYYREMTTSMVYSANVVQMMMYPVALRYVKQLEDGTLQLCKAFIVFLSEDLKHDYHQVLQMEKRMFEIVEEHSGKTFKNWLRKTDGCTAQFKSRFSTGQLLNMNTLLGKDLQKVEFQFFETDEGKNESDWAGALTKSYYEKGVMRPKDDSHEAPRSVEEVVDVIRANISPDLSNIEFFHVEVFPGIVRDEDPPEVTIKGIMKLHSLTRRPDGSILGLKLSCMFCSMTSVCAECSAKVASSSARCHDTVPPEAEEGDDGDDGEVERVETQPSGSGENNDDHASDAEQSDDDNEGEDEGFAPGSIVWIKIGRLWFPGKVVSPHDVAEDLVDGFMFVRRFAPFEDLNRVAVKNMDLLAENRVDAQRSSKNDDINLAYGLALSELVGDIV